MWVWRCSFQISGQAGKPDDVNASKGLSPWAQQFWHSVTLGYILSAWWEEGWPWSKSILLLAVPLCDFSSKELSQCCCIKHLLGAWHQESCSGEEQETEDQDREIEDQDYYSHSE